MKKTILKRFIFRFLSLLCVLCLLISSFLITTSAETIDSSVENYNNFRPDSFQMTMISSVTGEEIPVSVTCTGSTFSPSSGGNRYSLTVKRTDGYDFYSEYYYASLKMSMTNDDILYSPDYVDVSYDIFTYAGQAICSNHPDYTSAFRFAFGHANDWASTYCYTEGAFSYTQYNFNVGEIDTPYLFYWNNFFFRIKENPMYGSNVLYIFIDNVKVRFVSPDEKAAQIISNNNDANTSKIIGNQDKNSNKIINGGSDNPHYSEFDSSQSDLYNSLEEQVNTTTQSSRTSTISFFNNFGALLNDTPVSRGLLAVSKIYTQFFSIGWLSGLLQFSLALGAFSFILGAVTLVVGRVSRSDERRRERSERSAVRREKK